MTQSLRDETNDAVLRACDATPVLEARELLVLRDGRRIVDGASIRVRPGEAVAIQGASGSGKSTLARALATLIEPDAGTVLLDGRDAREIVPTQFRTRVAFLAQQPAMFAGTVRDNLEAGPALHAKSLGDTQAQELIVAVGLDESILPRDAATHNPSRYISSWAGYRAPPSTQPWPTLVFSIRPLPSESVAAENRYAFRIDSHAC